MRILADKMDEMERWGVIVKPETIGVVPTHVHSCILVPKEDASSDWLRTFAAFKAMCCPCPPLKTP